MNTIIRYTLITALRDWLFIGLLLVLVLSYGLSLFMGATALVEQEQMSLAYFAGSSRVILVIGMTVFICFHVRRCFENREIESMLSKPLSRGMFIVSYWLGFVLLAVMVAAPAFVITVILNSPDMVGFMYWSASVLLEVALMSAFSLLAALVLKSAVSAVLSSFAFYLMSRLMGFFVAALEKPSFDFGYGIFGDLLEGTLKGISIVMPRLDMFAKTSWLIHGVSGQQDLWIFQAQSVVYILLIMAMALFDLKRKQF